MRIKQQARQSSQVRPPHPQTKSHRSPRQPNQPKNQAASQPKSKPQQASQAGQRSTRRQRNQPGREPGGGDRTEKETREAKETQGLTRGGRKEPVRAGLLAQSVKNQQKRESSCCVGPRNPGGGDRAKPVRARLRAGSRKKRAKYPGQLWLCRQGPVEGGLSQLSSGSSRHCRSARYSCTAAMQNESPEPAQLSPGPPPRSEQTPRSRQPDDRQPRRPMAQVHPQRGGSGSSCPAQPPRLPLQLCARVPADSARSRYGRR